MGNKLTAGVLSLALLLSLAACGNREGAAAGSPEPSEEPAVETASREVTYRLDSNEFTAEDGTTLLIWSYQEPVVTGVPGADAINAASGARTELFFTGEMGVEALIEDVQWFYEEDPQAWNYGGSYALERTVSVSRLDDAVVSYVYSDYDFLMGAHGYTADYGVVYDAQSGAELTLADLSADEAALRAFAEEYVLQLSKTDAYTYEGYSVFFDGYEQWIGDVVGDGLWYFNEEGMVFISQPYVLGPYAAGTILFTIPYADLDGHIDARWLA